MFGQQTYSLAALTALFSLTLTSCGGSAPTTSQIPSFKQRQLEDAIFFLESNLRGIGEVGYVQWTPSTAAAELAATMNAAQAPFPGEDEELRQAGVRPPEPIPYVLNEPTDTWQIVLIPDEAAQMIHVQAYGKDLSQPVIEKDLPCCGY